MLEIQGQELYIRFVLMTGITWTPSCGNSYVSSYPENNGHTLHEVSRLTLTPAIALKRKMALGRLPNKSLAPVRNPLPKEKFRNENLLWALRRQSAWKWTRKAGKQKAESDNEE